MAQAFPTEKSLEDNTKYWCAVAKWYEIEWKKYIRRELRASTLKDLCEQIRSDLNIKGAFIHWPNTARLTIFETDGNKIQNKTKLIKLESLKIFN